MIHTKEFLEIRSPTLPNAVVLQNKKKVWPPAQIYQLVNDGVGRTRDPLKAEPKLGGKENYNPLEASSGDGAGKLLVATDVLQKDFPGSRVLVR